MTFRRRITLVSASAVAAAVLVGSALTYVLVGNELRGQIDRSLARTGRSIQETARFRPVGADNDALLGRGKPRVDALGGFGLFPRLRAPATRPGAEKPVVQVITATGTVAPLQGPSRAPLIPRDSRALSLAKSGGSSYFSDVHVSGDHLRVLTVGLPHAGAVQIGRSLNEVDNVLSRLRLILAGIFALGIALAVLLGRLVAGAALWPVRRLTETAEHVAETQDLARRIAIGGQDELGRLAVSFNAMLDALERSMSALDESTRAQRQLVADASHELRTPITSLRANIEILQQSDVMPAAERERMLADIVEQLEELTALVNDLIELARGDEPRSDIEDVRLDEIVAGAIERARRHTPEAGLEAKLAPTLVEGVPARLDRAVNNLIDNAIKFSPAGSPVEISLLDGVLTVRDHGPGIAPDDLPHIFDRFYRGSHARALPGSGLGLAIVRQVAEAHGGSISAQLAAGGGTVMRLRVPVAVSVPEQPEQPEQQAAEPVIAAGN
jgi:two-component system sensor histidine kinase MprB